MLRKIVLMSVTIALVTGVALFSTPTPTSLAPSTAQAQSGMCVDDMRGARRQMMQAASQCLGSAQDVASARLYMQRIENGEMVLPANDCARPVGVSGQLDAFLECARVYLCASQTLSCVVRDVPAGTSGSDPSCASTMNACQASHPIPSR